MAELFTVLFLISLIGLLIGVFKPDLILKRMDKEKWNRKKLIKLFSVISVVSLVLIGVTGMSEPNADEQEMAKIEEAEEKKEQEEKKAQEEAEAKEVEEKKAQEEAEKKKVESPKSEDDKTGEEYTTKLTLQSQKWTEYFNEFSDLMGNAQVGVDSWTLSVGVVITQMKELIEDARSINPPEEFKEVHKEYLNAVDKYESIPTQLPEAIDNNDVNLINSINEDIAKGNEYINKATKLLLDKK